MVSFKTKALMGSAAALAAAVGYLLFTRQQAREEAERVKAELEAQRAQDAERRLRNLYLIGAAGAAAGLAAVVMSVKRKVESWRQ